jgi:hypothetical protein
MSAYIGYAMLVILLLALILTVCYSAGVKRAGIILSLTVIIVVWLVTAVRLIVKAGIN